jgi:hypothetical protein
MDTRSLSPDTAHHVTRVRPMGMRTDCVYDFRLMMALSAALVLDRALVICSERPSLRYFEILARKTPQNPKNSSVACWFHGECIHVRIDAVWIQIQIEQQTFLCFFSGKLTQLLYKLPVFSLTIRKLKQTGRNWIQLVNRWSVEWAFLSTWASEKDHFRTGESGKPVKSSRRKLWTVSITY